MTINADDLVRRLAAILTDIEGMGSVDLEDLANSSLPEGGTSSETKARKMVRGLLRSYRGGHLNSLRKLTEKTTFVPASPGLDVIFLLPLSNGSFDRQHVQKTPVVAWSIDGDGYAEPIVPGMPVYERYAVLTPEGYVITDQYSFSDGPLQLKDWIESEIEWSEDRFRDPVNAFRAELTRQYGGPIAKAIELLMAGRPEWIGTSVELWTALADVDDDFLATKEEWSVRPEIFTAALKEFEPKLAGDDLFIAWVDDGRILIGRMGSEGAGDKGFPRSPQ